MGRVELDFTFGATLSGVPQTTWSLAVFTPMQSQSHAMLYNSGAEYAWRTSAPGRVP
jgi:hypothetical protein